MRVERRIIQLGMLLIAACTGVMSAAPMIPSEAQDSSGDGPRGLTTSIGTTLSGSSLAPPSSNDLEVYVGVGYNINPRFLVVLKVLTGREELDSLKVQPYGGRFELGGGEIVLKYRFFEAGSFRPMVSVSGGLCTDLEGSSGYHGQFARLGAGGEYFIISGISIEGDFWFRYRRWGRVITDGQFEQWSLSAIDRSFGVSLGCNLHFGLFP